jgi:hypothetical protein
VLQAEPAPAKTGARNEGLAQTIAVALVWALPFFLFYGRALADIDICVVDLLFLANCVRPDRSWMPAFAGMTGGAGWSWMRRPWVIAAAGIWLLEVGASVVAGPVHSVVEGVIAVRFFLFVAAVENFALRGPRARDGLWLIFAGLAVWTAVECAQQYFTGFNWDGYPRWADGALTGPFIKPRCGAVFLFVVLPGLLPVVLWMTGQGRRAWRVGGAVLLAVLLAVMILIGQRMPNLLFLLGLTFAALMVRQLRPALLVAVAVGVLAVAALPVISPPTFQKLVLHFVAQMGDFWGSPYGQLYTRASVMLLDRPGGWGFEGFKDFCDAPRFFHGWPRLGIPDAVNNGALYPDGTPEGCNLHPHNYFWQIAVMSGVAGLALFLALVVMWLRQIGSRLRGAPDYYRRAALLVTAAVIFWPFASTSSMFTLDTAGWVFLITGWGLASGLRRAD